MKNLLIGIIFISLLAACGGEKKSESVPLASERDTLSYSMGISIASDMRSGGIDTMVNIDVFLAGFNDVINNTNPQMTTEQAMQFLQKYFQAIQMKEFEKSKGEGENWIAENGKKEGVVTLPSGLQYKVITQGNGPKPVATDKVKTRYTGRFIDGTVFDSSAEAPVEFNVTGVIPAWTEILLMMPVGSKYELYVPWQLGYGERGAPPTIKPYSTLIFEMELVEISK